MFESVIERRSDRRIRKCRERKSNESDYRAVKPLFKKTCCEISTVFFCNHNSCVTYVAEKPFILIDLCFQLNNELKTEMMSYHFSKTLNNDFDTVIEKVTGELKKEGFGVLTQIDVQDTLKKKLDVDFRKYKILGACNPHFAYEALLAEDTIGTMLPCNVIVQERKDGKVEVSAVDPVASMMAIKNDTLVGVAMQVREKLNRVIDNL